MWWPSRGILIVSALLVVVPGCCGFRQTVTISNAGAALANHQVEVVVDTVALISSGKMNADCSDMLFRANDFTTPISHYIHSGCNTAATSVWLKAPSLPGGDTTLFMYYGDLDLAASSSGPNVFMLFDNFDGPTLSGWMAESGSAAKWDQVGRSNGDKYLRCLNPPGGRGIVYAREHSLPPTDAYIVEIEYLVVEDITNVGIVYERNGFDNYAAAFTTRDGVEALAVTAGVAEFNRSSSAGHSLIPVKHNLRVVRTLADSKVYLDGVEVAVLPVLFDYGFGIWCGGPGTSLDNELCTLYKNEHGGDCGVPHCPACGEVLYSSFWVREYSPDVVSASIGSEVVPTIDDVDSSPAHEANELCEGPVEGNLHTVSITGSGFGTAGGNVQVYIGSWGMLWTECTGASVVSDSEVTCMPGPSVYDGALDVFVVTEEMGHAKPQRMYLYSPPPVVEGISVPALHKGVFTTIYGQNFGLTANAPNFKMWMGTNPCTLSILLNSFTASCKTNPPSELGLLNVTVERTWGSTIITSAPAAIFTAVTDPSITSVTPPDGPTTGGYSVTLRGDYFGEFDSDISIDVGSVAATDITWVDANEITFTMPASTGTKTITLTIALYGEDNSASFTYLGAPSVTSLSSSSGVGGDTITVNGNNFGAAPNAVTVTIGGLPCTPSSYLSAGTMQCVVPQAAAPGPQDVVVTAASSGTSSPLVGGFTYNAGEVMRVTGVTPPEAPKGVATPVTVHGVNFGSTPITVNIGGTTCQSPNKVDDTITCLAQPTSSSGYQLVTVTTAGTPASATTFVYNNAPVVTRVDPAEAPLGGSTTITLHGSNFGEKPNSVSVDIGGIACTIPTWLSSTQVSCVTAGGTPGTKSIEIVSAYAGTPAAPFTSLFRYNSAPTIVSLDKSEGNVGGGQPLTITGTNFGTTFNFVSVTFGGAPARARWLSSSTIAVLTPPGSPGGTTIVVNVPFSGSVVSFNYIYNPTPTVESILPASGPAEGGIFVTITGTNFGTVSNPVEAYIDHRRCLSSAWLSQTQVVCETPPAHLGPGPAWVSVDALYSREPMVSVKGDFDPDVLAPQSPTRIFTYNPEPVLQQVMVEGPLKGGEAVVLHGLNFGPNSTVEITVAGTDCLSSKWLSSTSVECVLPDLSAFVAGLKQVRVRTAFAGTSSFAEVLYANAQQTISSLSIAAGSTLGGAEIILTANYFGPFDTPATAVLQEGAVCDNARWRTPNTMACTVPAHSYGPVIFDRIHTKYIGNVQSGGLFQYFQSVLEVVTLEELVPYGIVGSNVALLRTYDQYFTPRVDEGDDITVTIEGESGTPGVGDGVGVFSTVLSSGNGTYVLAFTLTVAKTYVISVTNTTKEVLSEVVTLVPGDLDSASIESVNSTIVAGNCTLALGARDQYGNLRDVPEDDSNFTLVFVHTVTGETSFFNGSDVSSTYNGGGLYDVEFFLAPAGTYDVEIFNSKTLLSLFTGQVILVPGDVHHISPEDPWINVPAGWYDLNLTVRDLYENPQVTTGVINVTLLALDRTVLSYDIATAAPAAIYMSQFWVTQACYPFPLCYIIEAHLDGVLLMSTPTTIVAGSPGAQNTTAENNGDTTGLSEVYVSQNGRFIIKSTDFFGNRVPGRPDDFVVSLQWVNGPHAGRIEYGTVTPLEESGAATGRLVGQYSTDVAGTGVVLSIMTGGEHIRDSPFTLTIRPDPVSSAAETVVVHPPVIVAVSGSETILMYVQPRDEFGNNQIISSPGVVWGVSITGPEDVVVVSSSPATVNGSFPLDIALTIAGEYEVRGTLDGVVSSRFSIITVLPQEATSLANTVVTGYETGVVSLAGLTFFVQTRDEHGNDRSVGGNDVEVAWAIAAPHNASGAGAVTYVGDGRYEVVYNATISSPAQLAVEISLTPGGALAPVPGSPFTAILNPGPTVASMCVAFGPGLEQSRPLESGVIFIQARDFFGNNRTVDGDIFDARRKAAGNVFDVLDTPQGNGRGLYNMSYEGLTIGGVMIVEIGLTGGSDVDDSIMGSPFQVPIVGLCELGRKAVTPCGPCEDCRRGSFSDTRNAPTCTQCPPNTITLALGTNVMNCTCMENFYVFGGPGKECLPCPVGGSCAGAEEVPVAEVGFFGTEAGDEFIKCPLLDACLGGPGKGLCAEGYEEYLCGKCSVGYYKFQGACIECDGDTSYLIVIFIIIIWLFVSTMIWINTRDRSHNRFTTLAIAFNSLQVTALYAGMDLRWAKTAATLFRVMSLVNFNLELASPECSVPSGDYFILKYYLFMFLPLLMIALMACTFFFMCMQHFWVKRYGVKFQEKHPNFCKPLSSHRAGVKEKVTHWLSTFFTQANMTPNRMKSVCVRAYYQILVFMYLPLTSQTLSYFACSKNADGKFVNDWAPSFLCFEGTYWAHFATAIIFSILYCLGIPLFVLLVLYFKRRSMSSINFALRYGFLTSRYTESFFWWEVTIMLRKVSVVTCMLFLNNDNNMQLAAAIVLLYVVTVFHHFMQPFCNVLYNRVEAISLASGTAILFFALVFREFSDPLSLFLFDFTVITMLLVNFTCIGRAMVLDMREWWRQEQEFEDMMDEDATVFMEGDFNGAEMNKFDDAGVYGGGGDVQESNPMFNSATGNSMFMTTQGGSSGFDSVGGVPSQLDSGGGGAGTVDSMILQSTRGQGMPSQLDSGGGGTGQGGIDSMGGLQSMGGQPQQVQFNSGGMQQAQFNSMGGGMQQAQFNSMGGGGQPQQMQMGMMGGGGGMQQAQFNSGGGQPQQMQMGMMGGQPQQANFESMGGGGMQQAQFNSMGGGQPQQMQMGMMGGQPQQANFDSMGGGGGMQQAQFNSMGGGEPQQMQMGMMGGQPQQANFESMGGGGGMQQAQFNSMGGGGQPQQMQMGMMGGQPQQANFDTMGGGGMQQAQFNSMSGGGMGQPQQANLQSVGPPPAFPTQLDSGGA